jgi:hypothetical protein
MGTGGSTLKSGGGGGVHLEAADRSLTLYHSGISGF